jgi:hypothetical protein
MPHLDDRPGGVRRIEWVETSAACATVLVVRFGGIKCGRAVGSQMARSDLRLCAAWARSGRFRLGVVVLVGLLAGAGCSDGGEDSGLPEITDVPTTSASPSGSPTWTPEQQAVIDGVTAYLELTDRVAKGASVDMRRLRAVASEPLATEIGKSMMRFKAMKFQTIGSQKYEGRSVMIRGSLAWASVCIDASKQRDMSTGPSPTQVTEPQPEALYAMTMTMTDRWRVAAIKRGKQC